MSKSKKNETIERKVEAICIPCPDPCILEINSNKSFFDKTEFSKSQVAIAHSQFNSTHKDKYFLHTYVWKPKHKCCQVLKARIQVKMTSLTASASLSHPNAGNDRISILKNGGIGIVSEKVYSDSSFPISKGEQVIKEFILTGNQLDWLNSARKLSVAVQDDTSVNWIKIRLEICCLKVKTKVRKGRT